MATIVNATLRHKRGTEESIPTLKDGQIYLCSDTNKIYKGTSEGRNVLIGDINSSTETNQSVTTHKSSTVTEGGGIHGMKIESGIFTPTIYGEVGRGTVTYTIQQGSYFKINKHVYCDLFLKIADYTEISGNIRIGGLPFSPDGSISCGSIGLIYNMILTDGYTQFSSVTIDGQSSLYINQIGNNKPIINVNETHLTKGCEIKLSINYNIK